MTLSEIPTTTSILVMRKVTPFKQLARGLRVACKYLFIMNKESWNVNPELEQVILRSV